MAYLEFFSIANVNNARYFEKIFNFPVVYLRMEIICQY